MEIEQQVALQQLDPALGWWFYRKDFTVTEVTDSAVSQEAFRFANEFADYLAASQLFQQSKAMGRPSVLASSAGVTSLEEQNQSVIVYGDQAAVLVPDFVEGNPALMAEVFNRFVTTQSQSGNDWSGWAFERDSHAYSSELLTPTKEETTVDIDELSEEVGISTADPTATETVQVYWHVSLVLQEPLWPFGRGEGVKVGVLDTGYDHNNPLQTAGAVSGISFVPGAPTNQDDKSHGTHVTGIIAARPGTHESGRKLYWSIAPGASHYSIKVLDSTGSGQWAWITSGLNWARNEGLDIVNLSLGGSVEPPVATHRAIQQLALGTAVIAAAGNNGPNANTVTWPARYREVIGVGAVDRNSVIAPFSSRGSNNPGDYVEDWVEVVAPGVDVWSNKLGAGQQDLIQMSGTSMACPVVVGICALLKQKDSTLQGTTGFRFRLRRSLLDLGIPGPDNWYGLGLVQFNRNS